MTYFRPLSTPQKVTIFLLFTSIICGCSVQSLASGYMLQTIKKTENHLKASENYHLVEKALPTFLTMLDTTIIDFPDDISLLVQGARMHVLYALLFIEEKNTSWAEHHYQQGLIYAGRALELSGELNPQKLLTKDITALEKKIAKISPQSLSCLFWFALSRGKIIQLHADEIEYLGDLPHIEAIMRHICQIDEDYENCMPLLFLGSIDRTKGHLYFKRALAATQRELFMVHVLYAKSTIKQQNAKLFSKLLKEVVQRWEKRSIIPLKREFNLINAVAYSRAKELLDEIEDLFLSLEEEE